MGLWLVFEKLTNGKPWICLDALPCSACQLSLFLSPKWDRDPVIIYPKPNKPPRLDCVSIFRLLFLSSTAGPEMLPVLATLQLPGSCLLYGPTG
jgi:hypothetical protein